VAGDCTQEPLQDFDAVDCRIALLTSTISGESPAQFGGARKAHALLMRLDNAQNQVDAARQGTKVRAKIRLAIRQLRTLNRALQKTIKNGKTPASVGDFLTARIQEALAELDQLSAAAPNAVVR
jgi:hypothetical protein